MTRIPLGRSAEVATAVGAVSGLVRSGIQAVGGVPGLLGGLHPEAIVGPDLDVLARIEGDRTHLMIGRSMALAAVGEAVARFGQLADVIQDGMGAAAAGIVFRPGAGPVVVGPDKAGADRRIAVAGIA